MQFKFEKCPNCNGLGSIMSNQNNPLAREICFDCIKKKLNYKSIDDAELFCRTYNIGFDPALWIKIADKALDNTFEEYAKLQFDDNGEYKDSVETNFKKLNDLWSRTMTEKEIIARIEPIKEGFILRAGMTWGHQYGFEQLIRLNSLYVQSVQANNITNPIQKESLKTLIKVMEDMNGAILAKDTTELKNLSIAYKTLAATAQLDSMIDSTHSDDITTLAEVAEIVENSGFEMPYYDGKDRDAIDFAIKDIEESNSRLIKTSTGLGPMIENMLAKYKHQQEEEKAETAEEDTPIEDIIKTYEEDSVATEEESDASITEEKFDEYDS